jgi:hypothetical protein
MAPSPDLANGTTLEDGVTHALSSPVMGFHFYALTKCERHLEWEEHRGHLDPGRRGLAVRTGAEVDCMACIAAGSDDRIAPVVFNPCGEVPLAG